MRQETYSSANTERRGNTGEKQSEQEDHLSEIVSDWFDLKVQAFAIEALAERQLSFLNKNTEDTPQLVEEGEEWDGVERRKQEAQTKQEREKLRLGIIMGGFSAWYRDCKISERILEELPFRSIEEIHSMYLKEKESEGRSEKMEAGNIEEELKKLFSPFAQQVAMEWEASQAESSSTH
ncbi:MAG: hypothetical protein IPL87_03430 [Candidatus Moraniibacteriota bacterium]|nr:MAG: hypothetical protein IPL87_03430 [Candidatus Moranbacteria bacterium]